MATYPEEQGQPISMMDQVGPGQPMPMPMMPPPPAPTVSPGLAAQSGMQQALAGRGGNPYLQSQQEQTNVNSRETMQMMGMAQQQQAQQQAQQMQMMQLQQRAKELKDRKETQDRELSIKVNQSLLESNNPDANKVGAAGMSQWSKTLGIDAAPEHFIQTKQLSEQDQTHASLMIKAGLPPEEIQARFPRATPQWIATQAKVLANPTAAKVMGMTDVDPALELQKREGERTKAWLEEFPEFGGKEKPDLFHLAGKYFREATGRELVTATRKNDAATLAAARERADKEIDERAAMAEAAKRLQVLAEKNAARVEAKLDEYVKVPAGGSIYHIPEKLHYQGNTYTNRDFKEKPRDFTVLNPSQKQLIDFLDMAPQQLDYAERLAKDLLAHAGPGKNLFQAAKMFMQGKLALSPEIAAYHAINQDVAIEMARALSGSGQLRIGVLDAIKKDIMPTDMDSIETGLTKIRIARTTLENRRRGILGESILQFQMPQEMGLGVGARAPKPGAPVAGNMPKSERPADAILVRSKTDPKRTGWLPAGTPIPDHVEVIK